MPDLLLIVSTCEHGLCYNDQLVSAPRTGVPRSTDLDRTHAIVQLQAGVSQNQDSVLLGASPSTICKLNAEFHIAEDVGNNTTTLADLQQMPADE